MTPHLDADGWDGHSLLLNRFLMSGTGSAIDLATGSPVCVRRATLSRDESLRRGRIGERLTRLVYPDLARLIDFGATGRGEWIEAWDIDDAAPPWRGPAAEAHAALARAARALSVVGCRLVRDVPLDVRAVGDRAVLVPLPGSLDDGEAAEAPHGGTTDAAVAGTAITWQPHAECRLLGEVLDTSVTGGWQTLAVGAPQGSGVAQLFATLAAAAQRRGWVPIGGQWLAGRGWWPVTPSTLAEGLRSRHVLVLQDLRTAGSADRLQQGEALARLVAAVEAHGRGHLVVRAVPVSSDVAMTLAPWPEASLLALAHPLDGRGRQWGARCRHALRRAGGRPAAFIRALGFEGRPFGDVAYVRHTTPFEVREQAVAASASATGRIDPGITRASDRARSALALVARGRHADGARGLQAALGALVRRGADLDAGRAALALGRVYWRRGLLERASEALAQARSHASRAEDTRGLVATLVLQGWVAMHADRLDEAEAVLCTARAAAGHGSDALTEAAALVSLALCYRWQERWTAATETLDAMPTSAHAPAATADLVAEHRPAGLGAPHPADALAAPLPVGCPFVVARALRALVVCGGGDPGRAARLIHAPGEEEEGDSWFPDALALRVHGALGDADRLARTLDRGLKSARVAREPLGTLELRLAYAEALFDSGDARGVGIALARLGRWVRARIPPLHRRRIEALERTCAAPAPTPRASTPALAHPEALRVLAACRDGADDPEILSRVCDGVLRTLGAHIVAVFGAAEGIPDLLARAGAAAPQLRSALVGRALETDLVVGPERTVLGIEQASPIQYGGLTVGALLVRWTALGRPDPTATRAALAAAALAAAPAVRALLDARRDVTASACTVCNDLVGGSMAMERVRDQIRRAATAPFPVLVEGESGTGKELVARALHLASPRRGKRFCAINCAAIGDELFEAELFGHTRGAFTGATADRPGLFEEADGGTLLLDEVGELSARAQAKLLRAIQEGEIRRVGENIDRRVDVRIVAATNRQLCDEARAGRFRQDLLFRLDVVRIQLPPLRERPDDIVLLAARFWREAAGRTGSRAVLAPATVQVLARYAWPGNVRELQNVLSSVAVRAPRRGAIGPGWLPASMTGGAVPDSETFGSLAEARRQFDERYVRTALARCGGQRARTAHALGLTRQGLAKLIDRLGIDQAC